MMRFEQYRKQIRQMSNHQERTIFFEVVDELERLNTIRENAETRYLAVCVGLLQKGWAVQDVITDGRARLYRARIRRTNQKIQDLLENCEKRLTKLGS